MSDKGLPISQLIKAIRQGSLHGVTNALEEGADIEEADPHGQAGLPLRTACFAGNISIVRELIDNGANVNAAGNDGPGMPLRLALRARNMGIAALLLDSGAEVPPGIVLPAELLTENRNAASPLTAAVPTPPLLDMPALNLPPVLPDPLKGETFTEMRALQPKPTARPEDYHILEEVDIPASYGVDTMALTTDLMRINDEEVRKANTPPPPSKR